MVRFSGITAYSRSSKSFANSFCQQAVMSLAGIISETFRNYITFELSDFRNTAVKQRSRNEEKKLSQTYKIALL